VGPGAAPGRDQPRAGRLRARAGAGGRSACQRGVYVLMSTSSVAVVLAVGVIATATSLGACDGAKPPPAPPPPAQVGFVVVEKRDVALYMEAVGTLDGYVNADIRARVRGYLERQHYQDGSQVTAGQVLFSIEPTEYQAAAKSANANLARARVGLAKNKLD